MTLPSTILSKVRSIELRTRRLVNEQLAGQYHSVFKGRGMNFDRCREYVYGDDIRTIDWNVMARTGKPHVKLFVEERELTLLLLIDVSGSSDFGSQNQSKRELAAEIASIMAFSALKNNDKVGLLLFTGEVELFIPPAGGRRHILRLIREILFFEPSNRQTDFTKALDMLHKIQKRKALVLLISDFCLPANGENALGSLLPKMASTARRHDTIALSINDKREFELPSIGNVRLWDAENGEVITLSTGKKSVRDAYTRAVTEDRQNLTSSLGALGIDFLHFLTGEDYMPALRQFFDNREHRR